MAIYPGSGFLAIGAALQTVYSQILETGSSIGTDTPLANFMDFSKRMGFEAVWDFEKKWADD